MDMPAWVRPLFDRIDARDAAAFAAFLAEDGVFRYGSQPAVAGREAVRDYVAGFFSGFAGLSHELQGFWWGEPGQICFVQGEVTYRLGDGRRFTVPFLNLFRLQGPAIAEYRIYADPTPLFAPA